MAKQKLLWSDKPIPEDYAAALSFMSLCLRKSRAQALLRKLRAAPTTHRSAKDLLRASSLPLLPKEEASVEDDLKKIAKGKPLSPVLLVCGNFAEGVPLLIADGYHRICAVCYFDEAAPVACKLIQP